MPRKVGQSALFRRSRKQRKRRGHEKESRRTLAGRKKRGA